EKHIDKFKKLKYVILNVEYFTLSQVDNGGEDVWRKYYYESYMDINVPVISTCDHNKYILSLSRNFKTNMELLGNFLSKGTMVDCDKNGFGVNNIAGKKLLNIAEIAPLIVKKHED